MAEAGRAAAVAAAASSSSSSLDAWPADPAAFPPCSYTDRDLERAAVAASAEAFTAMVQPGLLVASECGNMYAGEEGLLENPVSALVLREPLCRMGTCRLLEKPGGLFMLCGRRDALHPHALSLHAASCGCASWPGQRWLKRTLLQGAAVTEI